jgi:DNA-3-methyladenine glycosylase
MWNDTMPLGELLAATSIQDRSFFARHAADVARDLLGKVIVHGAAAGRIVEVEAYLGTEDLAAHAAAGITSRTRVLWGPPGRAYVYLIYGMYDCLNFVAETDGEPGCALIRALEPLSGVALMRRRRPVAKKREDLCSGPGKLTRALGITRKLYGADVTRPGKFEVRAFAAEAPFTTAVSPRIGISKCLDWPLRFYMAGSRYVSGRVAAGQ